MRAGSLGKNPTDSKKLVDIFSKVHQSRLTTSAAAPASIRGDRNYVHTPNTIFGSVSGSLFGTRGETGLNVIYLVLRIVSSLNAQR